MAKQSRVKRNHYHSIDKNPIINTRIGIVKPRRDYWGNMYEEDTYDENATESLDYDYSDYDSEDDIDSYYNNDN